MKKLLYIYLFNFLLYSCSLSTSECDKYFSEAEQNYIAYFADYDESLLKKSLKQINNSLQCNNEIEEKVKTKFTLLLFLKEFEKAKKVASEYKQVSFINGLDGETYVSLIECYDKGNEECVEKNVKFLLQELEENIKKKDEKYYMIYYDLKSYIESKTTIIELIEQNSNLTTDQIQLLVDYIEYNDNPIGAYATEGPFSKR